MTKEEMVNGINTLKKLFKTIHNNYENWFQIIDEKSGERSKYSKSGIWGIEKDSDGKVIGNDYLKETNDKFLSKLAEDSFLVEKKVTNSQYKLCVSRDKQNRIKKYIWARLIGDGTITVANTIFLDEDIISDKDAKVCFKFCNCLDIDEEGASNEEKKKYNEDFDALKEKIGKIKIEESKKKAWKSIDFSDNKRPRIIIDLFNKDNTPRDDYQNLLNEYTCSTIKLKALYKYMTAKGSYKEKVWKKVEDLFMQMHTAEEQNINLGRIMTEINDLIFDDCKQIVLTGAPGTGKTYSAKEYVKWQMRARYSGTDKEFEDEWKKKKNVFSDQWKMVQFHPSFDYTDFVEGIRPAKVKGETQSSFVRMDGVFKQFCRYVEEKGDKTQNYYFIIDEINRADLSKVFGELMFCLEENYRGPENTITTQYSNLDTYKMVGGYAKRIVNDVFKNGFYIPENVIIIGTMNDIDRSVDTFDFALRRRFRWINVEVDENLLVSTFRSMNKESMLDDEQIQDYAERINNMNKVFEDYTKIFRTPKDYFVGPAYFEGLFKGQPMESIWANKVEPLLNEYIRGRDAGNFIEEAEKKLFPSKKDTKDKESSNEGEQPDETETGVKVENNEKAK